MPDIFEIYGWLFERILRILLWIPIIAILGFILFWVVVGVGYIIGLVGWVVGALCFTQLLYMRL